ncbi:hypothetical protein COB21_04665 [Candidatus Aerophobetes bacterium]|uniref:NIF system FeS cluster assembly NifU C-terminal domain-containing protein n=1 Tax=Aerophobetes bacterium TaxID=2030807 RepID=A0A2A4X2C2_UNCAE|nr:MAG: hypothetical protein COB21_04665 [Candidatus Aerophobetes bacterium]
MVDQFVQTHPFDLMSEKLKRRIFKPRYVKVQKEKKASSDMEVVRFSKKYENYGVQATLFVVIDQEDGSVVDVSYIASGPTYLIGALESIVDLSLGNSLGQMANIGAQKIDVEMRDFSHVPAFASEGDAWINFALEMVEGICLQCAKYVEMDPASFVDVPQTPVGEMNLERVKNFSWDKASQEERLSVINKVLKTDVRPYIQMDEGDIEVASLEGEKLTVRYQGACVSCPSSIGGTLSAISNILQKRIFESLEVTVDMESLNL